MTTTYVFGAGASRDVGYPLASEMGDGLLDFMLKSTNLSIRSSGELFIKTFGKSPNVEDLITELQSRTDQLKDAQSPVEKAQRMRFGNSHGFLGNERILYDTSLGHEYARFWNDLWSQAAAVLKRCDRLVLCGYSLLPVDQRARDLLLQLPRKEVRIEVVSGNQTARIVKDFKTAGFCNVEAFQSGYFSDWCNAIQTMPQ